MNETNPDNLNFIVPIQLSTCSSQRNVNYSHCNLISIIIKNRESVQISSNMGWHLCKLNQLEF